MIITHICRAAAVVGFVLGVILVWQGLKPISDAAGPSTYGFFRDGLFLLFGSMFLGLLAEINLSLNRKSHR